MWKVNITMEDAAELSELLKSYQVGLPASEVAERNRVADLRTRLDDLIVVVQEENKIVEEYLTSIREQSKSKKII